MGKKRLIFDYGHGGNDSGAVLGSRYEKNDVLKLGRDVRKVIQRHGVIVDETRKGDESLSLRDRCNIANRGNYEFFISFHRNAFNGKAFGVETFTYTTQKPRARVLANNINNSMIKVGFNNRGVKMANFQVLRDTKTTAVLLEVGFIDNPKDNEIFDDNYNQLVVEIVKGILKTLDIKYIEETEKQEVFYRVVTGSFNNRKNAIERVEQLKTKGFNSFIDIFRG